MGARKVEKRTVTLEFDEFGHGALEEQTRHFGISSAEFLQTAAVYYLADIESGRAATRVPSIPSSPQAKDRATMELELETSAWHALGDEAQRQQVRLERLLEHAFIYFLADLDAGRVTTRILESLGGGESQRRLGT